MYKIKFSIMNFIARYKLCIFVVINMCICITALMVMYYLKALTILYSVVILVYFALVVFAEFSKYIGKNDNIAYNIAKLNINSVEIRVKDESRAILLDGDVDFNVPESFGQISKQRFIKLVNILTRNMEVYSLGFDMYPAFYVDNTYENKTVIDKIQSSAPDYMRVVDLGPEIEISDIIRNIEKSEQEEGYRLRVCKGIGCEEYKLYKCLD